MSRTVRRNALLGVHLAILLVMAIAGMTGPLLAVPRHCAPRRWSGALASTPSHRRRFRYRCEPRTQRRKRRPARAVTRHRKTPEPC